MFTRFKNFIFGEGWGGGRFDNFGEKNMKAFIAPTADGRFALNAGGEQIGIYTRRRDAVRGAARRELHLVA